MKVFSVVGFSKSGKTTVIENLITSLKSKGFKVAAIKNIHSKNLKLSDEGDTNRYYQKGADEVMGISDEKTFQIWNKKLFLSEVIRKFDVDYLIIEGMKNEPLPQIVCAKSEDELKDLVSDTTFAISGVIANSQNSYGKFKIINAEKEADNLTKIVVENVFDVLPLQRKCHACGLDCRKMTAAILKGERKRSDCVVDAKKDLILSVNGKQIAMVPFLQDIFSDTIRAFLKNLKGYEKGDIEIKIKNR